MAIRTRSSSCSSGSSTIATRRPLLRRRAQELRGRGQAQGRLPAGARERRDDHLKRRRYGDAVTTFETVAKLDPRNPKAHLNLGSAYRGKAADTPAGTERDDFLKKAELELKTALSLNPHYADADFNLGVLYLDGSPFPGYDQLVRLDNARRYFTQYKTEAGPTKTPGPVDDYLKTADKQYNKEQALQKLKAKNQAMQAPASQPTSSGATP